MTHTFMNRDPQDIPHRPGDPRYCQRSPRALQGRTRCLPDCVGAVRLGACWVHFVFVVFGCISGCILGDRFTGWGASWVIGAWGMLMGPPLGAKWQPPDRKKTKMHFATVEACVAKLFFGSRAPKESKRHPETVQVYV